MRWPARSKEVACKQSPLRGKGERQGDIWWKSVPDTRSITCKCLEVEPHPECSGDDKYQKRNNKDIMGYIEEKQRKRTIFSPVNLKYLYGTFLRWLYVKSSCTIEISEPLLWRVLICRVLFMGIGRGSPQWTWSLPELHCWGYRTVRFVCLLVLNNFYSWSHRQLNQGDHRATTA